MSGYGTGNTSDSSSLDLAGLVCNKLGNHQCINPMKGKQGGQTWEYIAGYIDGMISEKKNPWRRCETNSVISKY